MMQRQDLSSILYDPLEVSNENSKVVLLQRQITHFHTIINILKTNHYYIDTSPTGSGKTYTTLAVAIATKRKLLIVCPKMVKVAWQSAARLSGVKLFDIITYHSITGSKMHSPKNYLTRKETEINQDLVPDFECKPDILRIWEKERVLIVFDEIHVALSENSAQMRSVSTLFRMALSHPSPSGSRMCMLSATVMQKEEFSIPFFRMIGMLPLDLKFVNKNIRTELNIKARANLIQMCRNKAPEATDRVLDLIPKDATIATLAYQLLHQVIKPLTQAEMPKPVYKFAQDNKRAFYLTDQNDEASSKLKRLNMALGQISSMNTEETQLTLTEDKMAKMGAIMNKMWDLQKLKVPILVRLIRHRLVITPEAKIVVFSDIIEGLLDEIKKELENNGYHILMLTGKQNEQQNEDALEKFNSIDLKYRVILCTTSKGGVGINLHDIDGSRPRYVFMLPSFRVKDMHQAAGRTLREGIKSNSQLRVVYFAVPNDPEYEDRVMASILRKSKVMKDFNLSENKGLIEYPGDYQKYFETKEEYTETLKVVSEIESDSED
jgi:superfamily II DNA or RNA helicase